MSNKMKFWQEVGTAVVRPDAETKNLLAFFQAIWPDIGGPDTVEVDLYMPTKGHTRAIKALIAWDKDKWRILAPANASTKDLFWLLCHEAHHVISGDIGKAANPLWPTWRAAAIGVPKDKAEVIENVKTWAKGSVREPARAKREDAANLFADIKMVRLWGIWEDWKHDPAHAVRVVHWCSNS